MRAQSAIVAATIFLVPILAAAPQAVQTGGGAAPPSAGVEILKTAPPAKKLATSTKSPFVKVIDAGPAGGILGRPVVDAAGNNMGRIVDVIVDPAGHVLAAVIDFGGFLGVGSRKIAVDWAALRFGKAVKQGEDIRLELTKDQIKAAPEYKDGKPLIVIGASGELKPLNFPTPAAPEK